MSMIRVNRMVESAPKYYETSKLYLALMQGQSREYDSLEAGIDDLVAQFRVQTATWGLRYFEETLEIPVNEQDSLENRRGRILARYRSDGNFSVALLKSIASSFVNGQIEVTFDRERSTFLISFVGNYGVPERIKDVQDAINNVVHAHLAVEYVFRYLTWDEFDAKGLTWDQLDTANKTWDQLEVWK